MKNQQGYLLIELMVSMVVLAIGLLGVLGMASDSYSMVVNIDRSVAARILATNRLEELTAPHFDDVASVAAATPNGTEQVGVNNTVFTVVWQYQSTGSASDPIRVLVTVDYDGSPNYAFPISMSTLKTNFL